jgi:hypothetical protein
METIFDISSKLFWWSLFIIYETFFLNDCGSSRKSLISNSAFYNGEMTWDFGIYPENFTAARIWLSSWLTNLKILLSSE